MLTALELLRVTPASPKPGAARVSPSASQGPRLQRDHRPDPDRDRPAHEARTPASSPRVPDAQRNARPPSRRRYLLGNKIDGPIPTEFGQLTKLGQLRVSPASPTPGAAARPPLGVAGGSRTTRSPARSRSKPAASRRKVATPRLTIPASSRRAARGSVATGNPVSAPRARRSRSLASPTIPRRRQSCEFPPRPRSPARPRDRSSASQVAPGQRDHRHVPDRSLRHRGGLQRKG